MMHIHADCAHRGERSPLGNGAINLRERLCGRCGRPIVCGELMFEVPGKARYDDGIAPASLQTNTTEGA